MALPIARQVARTLVKFTNTTTPCGAAVDTAGNVYFSTACASPKSLALRAVNSRLRFATA